MAVHHEVPALGGRFLAWRLGDDDGIAVGRASAGIKADVATMFHEPVGAGLHVRAMLWLGGNTAEADVGAKFIHESCLVAREIIQNRFHAREYSESAAKAKLD